MDAADAADRDLWVPPVFLLETVMRKGFIFVLLLLCMTAVTVAEAGQYRVSPPRDARKRPPPPGYRSSYLEIVNDDDRGYALELDYRRNRIQLVHRTRGDVYVPANSRITLVFDDDDNWYVLGDNDSLEVEIRQGRTTTLRLETRANRRQIGLFGTVENGPRRYSKQLFKYAERPSRPGPGYRPAPPPPITRPPLVTTPPPAPPRPTPPPPSRPTPPRGGHGPSTGEAIGAAVGGLIESLVDDKNRR